MEHAVEVWLVDMRQAWPMLLARAVFAVAFGLVALIWPTITLLILAWAFGIYAIIDGAIQIIDGIRRRDRRRLWISLLLGLLALAAGVLALIWPGITAVALAIVVGAWALVTGLIEIFSAVRQRRERRRPGLLLLVGLVSVVAGVVILAWPVLGAVALAALVGGFAVVYGILLAVLALRLRNAAQATMEPFRGPGLALTGSLTTEHPPSRTPVPATAETGPGAIGLFGPAPAPRSRSPTGRAGRRLPRRTTRPPVAERGDTYNAAASSIRSDRPPAACWRHCEVE